jgi:OOP family OmpA-OmpF porin
MSTCTLRTRRLTAIVALLASAGLAGTASAQPTNERTWYLLPGATLLDPDSDWRVDKRSWGPSLRAGVPLSEHWDLQIGGSRNRSSQGTERYTQTLLGADALYLFNRGSWRPFLLGGLAWERDRREGALLPSGSRSSPALALGAGLQWQPSQQLGLQLDVRRVSAWLRDHEPLGFKRSDNHIAQIGLIWRFDAAAPAPAPVRQAAPPPPPPAPVLSAPAPASVIAPPPPPPPPPPAPLPQRITLAAEELFAFDSATLKSPQPALDRFADDYQRSGSQALVRISGHTDRLGKPAYNQRLSQRRADAVRDYLQARGLPAARLQAQGRGASAPKVKDCKQGKRAELIVCLAPNRRVELEPISVELPMPMGSGGSH